jgi:hypothetical protein
MHTIKAALRLTLFALVLALAFLPAGCGGFHGGTSVESDVRATTTGQELLDLEKAKQAGVISEKEYDKQKKKILDRK